MKLSKYISLSEAIKSETAIRKGIDNTPNEEQIEAMRYVAINLFDPVREHLGGPLYPSSFFRCEKLNKAIGGSPTSQHKKGEAIDMDADHFGIGSNKKVFDFIKSTLVFDQLIWEFGDTNNPAWVHASLKKDGNRREVLKAYKDAAGKTKYVKFDLY